MISTRLAFAVAMIHGLSGCGGDDQPPSDGSVPPTGGPTVFVHQNLVITDFAFPPTVPHGRASALFVVRNDTNETVAGVVPTLDGDPSFAIDASSTCNAKPELVPHDLCTVLVRWTTATGDASTQLVITSGDVTSRLPVHGTIAAAFDVIVDTSAIDFAIVPATTPASTTFADVQLTNTTTHDINVLPSLGPPFQLLDGGTTCPGNALSEVMYVPANASCTVRLGFAAPAIAGWFEGIATLAGEPIVLDAYAARGVVVGKTGSGTGRVHSVPSAIDCDGGCTSQVGYPIGDATLYEVPDDGSHFAGWARACGTDPSCVVPERVEYDNAGNLVSNVTVPVTFAGPGSSAVSFTVAGTGAGSLLIGTGAFAEITECTHDCTTYVPAGTQLEVHAITPSRFAGWAGACATPDIHCSVTVTGDAATTATFVKDDGELAVLFPRVSSPSGVIDAIAFAPDGDLLIAAGLTVQKLGLDGTVRWSTTGSSTRDFLGTVAELVVTADGLVLSRRGFEVVTRQLATGVIGAERALPVATCQIGSVTGDVSRTIATAPNGDIGAIVSVVVDGKSTTALHVERPDGTTRFEVALGTESCGVNLAVGADGVYRVLVDDQVLQATSFHVQRFDADGVALPVLGPYAVTGAGMSVAVDAAGALAFTGQDSVGRILADGSVGFVATVDERAVFPTAIGYDLAGEIISGSAGDGFRIEVRDLTGALTWALDKHPVLEPVFRSTDITIDAAGSIAVAGSFALSSGVGLSRPWVAVYRRP